ncbi:hypothetical protein [Flavobacterium sp.]|uniref:hypothetical protein n=1 Tax=Flavobacterium sp. TaxID=239 RepID=UPI003F6A0A0C
MKTKLILIAFLFLSATSQAQLLDEINLKDYGILTNDVVKITEKSFNYAKNTNSYKEPENKIYDFDSQGFILSASLYDKVEYGKTFIYNQKHDKVTKLYGNGKKFDFDIIKVPYGNVLIGADKYEVLKNSDGSIMKIDYSGDTSKLSYNFSYNGNIITVNPSNDGLNTTRATKDGLLLSEENKYMNLFYSYDSKSKLLSQKVSIIKTNTNTSVHYINVYAYDKKGNWIVKYELSAVPLYGISGNNITAITVRELTYKDKTKTGQLVINDLMKANATSFIANMKVKDLDKSNLYATPIYIDYDANELLKLNATNMPLDANCVGDCQNGWGKYSYNNGYYDGFWENGQKSGYGIYKWNNGDLYLGHWYKDKMSGFGQTIFENGNEYAGGYLNGKYDGYAIFYSKTTDKNQYNKYKDGKFEVSNAMNNNGVSVGCTHGDCNNGFGRYAFESGGVFIGQFVNKGLYMGVYYFKNGDVYQGTFDFKTNKFSGYGHYQYKESGEFYKGIWANGKQNGRGLSYSQGNYYKDEWKDDKVVKSF